MSGLYNELMMLSGSLPSSSPARVRLTGLLREAHQVTTCWHELTRDKIGSSYDTQSRRPPEVEVYNACKFLHGQVGILVRLPACTVVRGRAITELDGVQAGLELLSLHTRMRNARARYRAPKVGAGSSESVLNTR